jgi:NADH-quinone oxidoreductase subunit D
VAEERTLHLSMGPQHPSTHGVLQVLLELDGEIIRKAIPVAGYLHRGIEKIAEHRTYHQIIPLTDRLDYAACFQNNVGYCLAIEKLLGIEAPPRAQALRVIGSEISRMGSHCLWIGTHAMDIGAITVFMYAFREREGTYDLFEKVAGHRMMPSWGRIGGVSHDLPDGWIDDCRAFLKSMESTVNDIDTLLTKNRIWLKRVKDVGVITKEQAIDWGMTGPMLRGSGVEYDVRKAFPYCGYENYDFDVPVGETGDTYDRYLCRMEEYRQSIRIVEQALDTLPDGPILADEAKAVFPEKQDVLTNMEDLIHQFYLATKGLEAPVGEVYVGTESARGELGFTVVSHGGSKPHRLKIRVPSFSNLQCLDKVAPGCFLADIAAIIGTIDICLADVDK